MQFLNINMSHANTIWQLGYENGINKQESHEESRWTISLYNRMHVEWCIWMRMKMYVNENKYYISYQWILRVIITYPVCKLQKKLAANRFISMYISYVLWYQINNKLPKVSIQALLPKYSDSIQHLGQTYGNTDTHTMHMVKSQKVQFSF